MKKYILSAWALLFAITLPAQNNDEIILKGMKDEINRNMNELKLEHFAKPSFINYVLLSGKSLVVKASLGSVVDISNQTLSINGVRMMLGDFNCTSDCGYKAFYYPAYSSAETNYDKIRRDFWMTSDAAYKMAAPELSRKFMLRKQRVRDEKEAKLADFLSATPITKIENGAKTGIDRAKYEKNAAELSAIFKNYPAIFNSTVSFGVYDISYYTTSSEGTVTKQPMVIGVVNMSATVRTKDGADYSDKMSIIATSDLTLPSMKELKAKVDEFAKNLNEYLTASEMTEFYSGPVLFVDDVVSDIFTRNLLTNAGVLTARKAEDFNSARAGVNTKKFLDNRIGQRVVDNRLTVKNVSALKSYKGIDLLGYYTIDAEGVVPAAELVVIDTGIMKNMLNGRIPTTSSPASTGSERFILDMRSGIASAVVPGTVKIEVRNGKKRAELEAELIKMAKSEGHKYAFIVAKTNGGDKNFVNYVYKVDVETGKKTMVRCADPGMVTLSQMKKLTDISSEESVRNMLLNGSAPCSMIYPNAILIENYEISELEITKNKVSPIVNPTERAQK